MDLPKGGVQAVNDRIDWKGKDKFEAKPASSDRTTNQMQIPFGQRVGHAQYNKISPEMDAKVAMDFDSNSDLPHFALQDCRHSLKV